MKDYSVFVIISYIVNDLILSGFAMYALCQYFKIKKRFNEK